MAHDGNGTGWDELAPTNSELVKDGALEIRDLRKAARIRLEKEHILPAASSVGGEHKMGSAVAYVQATATAVPTQTPAAGAPFTSGGAALSSADDGRFWFDTDDRTLHIYDDSSTEADKWSPLGMVPVGSIIAWHKTLTGMVTLPSNWVECNAGAGNVNDTESPIHGQPIPELNADGERTAAITSGGGAFLRGDTTSGTFADDTIQHHDHDVYERATSATTGAGLTLVQDSSTPGSASATPTSGIVDVKNSTHHTAAGDKREGNETQPFNMTVVWIMRIK